MWGRVIEIMTAVYLALSPFFFGAQSQSAEPQVSLGVALLIGVLSGVSFWRPAAHAHYFILLVATGLVIYGRLAGSPPPPVNQNHIVIGLFLLMIAVIPNEASHPPLQWRETL